MRGAGINWNAFDFSTLLYAVSAGGPILLVAVMSIQPSASEVGHNAIVQQLRSELAAVHTVSAQLQSALDQLPDVELYSVARYPIWVDRLPSEMPRPVEPEVAAVVVEVSVLAPVEAEIERIHALLARGKHDVAVLLASRLARQFPSNQDVVQLEHSLLASTGRGVATNASAAAAGDL